MDHIGVQVAEIDERGAFLGQHTPGLLGLPFEEILAKLPS
jgi:hypothetical protein